MAGLLPKQSLGTIYRKLYRHFGPQHWWPAESPFEVMVGAVLTQNTNWANVEKALGNLKRKKALTFSGIAELAFRELAEALKPSGYYRLKAKRLTNLLAYLGTRYNGDLRRAQRQETAQLRKELLGVNGIGQETADAILLYAFDKPVFVVDAYTTRILTRHRIIAGGAPYHQIQKLFMDNLKTDSTMFNEYHALLVRLAKEYCRKRETRCPLCPLYAPTSRNT